MERPRKVTEVSILNQNVWINSLAGFHLRGRHLLLTNNAICALVFNLTKMKTNAKSENEIIQFWLESIAVISAEAPLLILGTLCTDLDENITEYFTRKRKGLKSRGKN